MSNSTSSPPPPSENFSASSPPPPPPPSDSSQPPPPPPSDSSQPPPPPPSGSPPPPSQSPPPPPPPSNNNNKSPPPPPKSNSGSSNNGNWNSPPPPSSSKSLSSPTSSSNNDPLASVNSMLNENVMFIGLAAAAGLLILILVSFLISCARRRKRNKPRENMMYYRDASHGNNSDFYHNSSGWPSNAPRNSHDFRMPPSAQVSSEYDWQVKPPPPPPQMLSSAEIASRTSSGSQRHGLTPPPLHPQMSIGYNQSSFSYEDLASATGGFASTNLLGQGGFGYVHKGVLPNGKEVAVKSLKANSGQGEREFQAEVDIISRVHHRHLVSLVGYCIAGSQRMLVYEFVANDTLESRLHGDIKTPLDWPTRLAIAVGSAKGFAYLHEDCHPRIIHRDIKASNILLDENFEAKVADFGLAKLSSDTMTHVSTRIMGTFGYLAPEYAASGKLSEKSDVYSFGVVLLELITGKRPIDISSDEEDSLVDWARPILTSALEGECGYEELADPLLEGNYNPHEMQCMIACASACVRHSARRRPRMSQVVRTLEGDGSLSDLDEIVKTSRQISQSSSEYDLRRMKKTALSSQEFSSNEFGRSGEYGNSSGESRAQNTTRRENVEQLA